MLEDLIFKKILEQNENGFIILNLQRKVLYTNKKIEQTYGLGQNKILGNYLKCLHTITDEFECQKTPDCPKCFINLKIEEVIKTGETQTLYDLKFHSKKNTMKSNCRIYKMDKYIIIEFFNLSEDEKKKRYLAKLLDKANDLIFFKDANFKYKYVNESCTKMFGLKKEEIYEKLDEELLPEHLYHQCLKGDLNTLEKGSYVGIETYGDRSFQVLKEAVDGGILGVAKDITKELEQQHFAEIDSLTELFNRRKFLKMIDSIYNKKSKEYYLILIDLDNLRDLNNNYGHAKGDQYLKSLGEILNSYPESTFFRLGGDEFAGLINRNFKEVDNILKEILEKLSELNLEPNLTISVGAQKIDLDKSYLENYTEIDKLLYQAKLNGKNCYILN
ncbi:MAG: diguanylate cyclase domain-containing protein [Cetobacterium sp.]|uniref:sensor domain-containing diguanylate cyclase n=1 Tax=Cetobacterium sp. TaxID=2071632 RepID=UPI003F4022E8